MVSVLTTTYNRQDFVAEAVGSVLASSFGDFQYIVEDDCSKDNAVEILKGYEKIDSRIRVYQNEKKLGDYNNRNKAASYTTCKHTKYSDSDDLLHPHCLQVMVDSMERFPEAGFGLSARRADHMPDPVSIESWKSYLEHFNVAVARKSYKSKRHCASIYQTN